MASPIIDPDNIVSILHKEIGQRLFEHLDLILLQPKLILDLNPAMGGLTTLLARRFRPATILQIDENYQLLHQAKKNAPWLAKRCYTQTALHQLPILDHSIDLIFANLRCFEPEDLKTTLCEFKRILAPQGLLLFSTLGPDTLQELQQSSIHAFLDMHNIGDLLMQTGFTNPVMDMEKLALNYQQPDRLLTDLISLSQAYSAITLPADMTTKELISHHKSLTLEVIYGHAWGSTTNKLSGETRIPISTITRR